MITYELESNTQTMKTNTLQFILLCLIPVFALLACKQKKDDKESQPGMAIPDGDVQVAVYYFPNWGPVDLSEWAILKQAKPKFEGHKQPKVPAWGYQNENDPEVMAQKIDAAADNGVDAFIFDWYYYDADQSGGSGETSSWQGSRYLYMALEDGFLQAAKNDKMKFSLMWCNHDLGPVPGAVKPETFEALTDYVIEHYFTQPSYWLIEGCPYFSIYQFHTFLETYDNDIDKAAAAIERFRSKVKAAGFPDLHLNGCLWGVKSETEQMAEKFQLSSITSYVWIHHNRLPDFPATKYEVAADNYFNAVQNGGGHNGLEKPASALPTPYYINVSMGWDSSPRCRNASSEEWMNRRDYPFGAVIVENTPYLFKKYLAEAKALTMEKPENERIITINSWNEWGEGSYLEPDTENGMEYLHALRAVFGHERD
jgi:hypothetical protein